MRRANTVVLAALVAVALPAGPAVLAESEPATSGSGAGGPAAKSQEAAASDADRAGCEALLHLRTLTITYAGLAESSGGTSYCYVRGILRPAIHFHVQLPLPGNWNGRFLKWGDGGKDGDLDFADHRVAEGYAVANSNTGHDNGAEPGSSFAYDNRQAEIDFGYRAVHLTVAAAKTLVASYYGREPAYSYFEGCSTGGRQGLMEAQRYPTDFDGIVAGAPANHYQEMNAVRVWLLQRMFRDDFAGALATDTDGDGRLDSVRKLDLLADAVVAACDRDDGVAGRGHRRPAGLRLRPRARPRGPPLPGRHRRRVVLHGDPDPHDSGLPRRAARPARGADLRRQAVRLGEAVGGAVHSLRGERVRAGSRAPRRRPPELPVLRRRPRRASRGHARHLGGPRQDGDAPGVGVVGLRHR